MAASPHLTRSSGHTVTSTRSDRFWILGLGFGISILLLAWFLRIHHLGNLPPGWRDDEVVETTLHAQMILDGQHPLFFVQAEGHEPLYHYLAAGLIALTGNGLFQVRLLSAFFGLLSVAALYSLARKWFGAPTAVLASLALAVSFWSLMYSRTKTRHVSVLVFAILAFCLFDRLTREGFKIQDAGNTGARSQFEIWNLKFGFWILGFGLSLSLSLYTYFAARTLPLILLAFVLYLALVRRETFRARWRGIGFGFALATVLSAPLFIAERLAGGAGAERLSVVGGPLKALFAGDYRPALDNTLNTLSMFAFRGDPEALYNLPGRPVFEAIGAVLLLIGLLVCLIRWKQARYAFVVIWLFGGLAPAFVSTPAASFGHTIVTQPAVYLLPAIGLTTIYDWQKKRGRTLFPAYFIIFAFLGLTALRDLRDYFVTWPADSQVRFLYRAGLHEAAAYLREDPPDGPLTISTLNVDPRDPLAFALDMQEGRPQESHLQVRFFDPARAIVYPNGNPAPLILTPPNSIADAFQILFALPEVHPDFQYYPTARLLLPCLPTPSIHCPLGARRPLSSFADGLTFYGYSAPRFGHSGSDSIIYTFWQAGPDWTPLPLRQPSDPTQTQVGLKIFLHLSRPDGTLIAGADDFGVEPSTLQPGDVFVQLHTLSLPVGLDGGKDVLTLGLYDPFSGKRVSLVGVGDEFFLGKYEIRLP